MRHLFNFIPLVYLLTVAGLAYSDENLTANDTPLNQNRELIVVQKSNLEAVAL